MQIKTILNRVAGIKPFVIQSVQLLENELEQPELLVNIVPRANGQATCSSCGTRQPGYDTLDQRRFQFVSLWMIPVFFVYAMRRVNCRNCQKVKVEHVPWSDGKGRLTTHLRWFLAGWARRMSWRDVATSFHVSWDDVFEAVKHAVKWGLEHRSLDGIKSIGVDEVAWKKGHRYQTLVYQIDEGNKRLLWVGPDRKAKTFLRFFRMLGKERYSKIEYVCSDMWKAYLKVIKKKIPDAIHVLDRFHVMQKFGKALNKVRAGEARQLKADGYEPVLKGGRWLLLKRPENLLDWQMAKLSELLEYNLKSVKAYLMKEDFQQFWTYKSAYWAGRFLDSWCTRAMRSKIEPMKDVAKTLRNKRELLLNWFKAEGKLSSGVVEGFNNKVKLITRKSYGFRTQNAYETALYHNLGQLPMPEFTHRFF